jgi:hypothetical protein
MARLQLGRDQYRGKMHIVSALYRARTRVVIASLRHSYSLHPTICGFFAPELADLPVALCARLDDHAPTVGVVFG